MMNAIDRREALVLRVTPFSNTSQIVHWLTRDCEHLATLVKGACRNKSPFRGQYDLFYTCEILYYRRARDDLHIARECAPLAFRLPLRNRWRAYTGASYVCDLVSRVSPAAPQAGLYGLLVSVLDSLSAGSATAPVCCWFELHLLSLLGMAPRLAACAVCGAASPRRGMPRFSARRGGLLCAACARSDAAPSIPVAPDIAAILRHWQSSASPRIAAQTRCERRHLLAFRDLLGMFLEYHVDVRPPSRRIAFSMLV